MFGWARVRELNIRQTTERPLGRAWHLNGRCVMAIPLLIRRDRPGQRWGSPFHTSLLRAVAAVGLGPMLMLSLMGCEVGPDYQAPAVLLEGVPQAAPLGAP